MIDWTFLFFYEKKDQSGMRLKLLPFKVSANKYNEAWNKADDYCRSELKHLITDAARFRFYETTRSDLTSEQEEKEKARTYWLRAQRMDY